MKITFVLPGIGVGGGVRVVFEYANLLIERGHDVYIVYPIIPPIIISRSKVKLFGRKIIGSLKNLKQGNKVEWFDVKAKLIRVPTLNPKFVSIVKKWIPNSDAIIATSWETAYFVNALPKEKGEKFYFVQHYEIWDIWNNLKCWKKIEKLEKDTGKLPITMSYITPEDQYLKRLKEVVDATYTMPLKKITISSWLKELLEKRFKQEIYGMIINGVNFDIFYCDNEKNWDAEKRIILMPYRGIPWKGDLDGLKALEKIYRKYGNKVEIWLYGPKKPNNLSSWVKFFEGLSDEELRRLYCKAHILVIPSWVEGCQLPPMEGMACKCAVVATNVGGVPDYAIPNETTIVVPPRNSEKLAKGISYLLDNWDEAKRIAERGYNHIKQFTWEIATIKFENAIYNGIR
ncbi:glycosyltransferase family 4 protein [Methanothermococcus sp. SCGC AD-155-C09]|nr:glycosyltransferase family 4 protein [Methanothermococcus sp. SCGC AD-155-C09]